MKFQVGDKVVVKHTGEEAEVVELINAQMVMLEVRTVRFPAYIDQLDFPYFQRFSGKKLFPEKKEKKYIDDLRVEKKPAEQRKADGVWLSFLPVFSSDEFGDEVVDELKIHLINRTDSAMHFQYELTYVHASGFELKNDIHPFEDFYLHDIPFESLNDSPLFSFEFSLMHPDKKKAPYHESFVKLKARQVFQQVMSLREKGEATFTYRLMESYPDKLADDGFMDLPSPKGKEVKIYDISQLRSQLEAPKTVIDLHIEVLDPHHDRLSNAEKLLLQLQTFEKYVDLALWHHQNSLIVIHGVGSGRLRDEIHERLRARNDVKSFINRYHPAYGYGATEIYFN